ncbi:MAG: phosphatase PAP2 family protein [Vicinamibacterales bacterium]
MAFALCLCLAAAPPVAAQAGPQPVSGQPPQPGVFKDLGHDIKGLGSPSSLTWLGAGLATTLATLTIDDYVTDHFADDHGTEEAFEPGEVLGGVAVQAGSAVAVYALGRAFHQPAAAALGADLVRAQILTQAITQAIKFTVDRTRPDGTARSFPSGHASTSFATVTVLQRYFGWKVGVPGYGLAAYVAASRIQSRKHYLSDVVFGATIGIVVGRVATVGHGWATFAPVPVVTRGATGINFVRIEAGR